jgi:TRAP-type C4-dicarboxylate transport system permease small subunit
MHGFRKAILALSGGLDRVISGCTIVFLVVLVAVVMLQVVARYVFASPPPWTEEAARYAMIWAGLLGATMSFKRRFDPALFKEPGQSALLATASLLMQSAIVLIYLLPILWHTVYGPYMNPARGFLLRHSRMMADALPFPTILVAISVPIMIVTILIHLSARWCGDDRPAEVSDPEISGRQVLD